MASMAHMPTKSLAKNIMDYMKAQPDLINVYSRHLALLVRAVCIIL